MACLNGEQDGWMDGMDEQILTDRSTFTLPLMVYRPKFLKQGKVVVIVAGRYAGKKAVIVQNKDEGSKERPYGHALVIGIERCPQKVTRNMPKEKISRRTRVKPFIKMINYNHMMPTRYAFDLEKLKKVVTTETVKEPAKRVVTKKTVKKILRGR